MPGLQRYVAHELVHFVGRGKAPDDQFELLITILQSGWLTHPPHQPNISGNLTVNRSARLSSNQMYNPEIICFCDIPTEDLHIHTAKYSRFGLSLLKTLVAAHGGCPVFYLPRGTKVRQLRRSSTGRVAQVDAFEEIRLGDQFDQMVPGFHRMMDLFGSLIMEAREGPGVPEESRELNELPLVPCLQLPQVL